MPISSTLFFIFKAILASLCLILFLSWVSILIARRIRLIDYPGSAPHKKHNHPTPIAGGIALAMTLFIAEWLLGNLDDPTMRITFLAAAFIFVFGIWDDLKSLPPLVKLCGQLLAVLVLIRLGIYIQILESPEFIVSLNQPLGLYLDWLLTIFWIVGITNAFNFVDSMDGLAVGLGAMAAAFFMLVTLESGQPTLTLHSALLVGACIGLYFFNAPPARLFLGDSGAQTLGFILAVLAIIYRPLGANQSTSWLVPILLLGVPIFDTTLIVLSRLRRGLPIYSAAHDHTYHRLLKFGLEPPRAVLVMQVAGLALGCLAFVLLPQTPLIANFVFALVVLVGIVMLLLLDRRQDWEERYQFDLSQQEQADETGV